MAHVYAAHVTALNAFQGLLTQLNARSVERLCASMNYVKQGMADFYVPPVMKSMVTAK